MAATVPCRQSAHIGLISQIFFSRVGASDDLARGRSTFYVVKWSDNRDAILNQADDRALVILDDDRALSIRVPFIFWVGAGLACPIRLGPRLNICMTLINRSPCGISFAHATTTRLTALSNKWTGSIIATVRSQGVGWRGYLLHGSQKGRCRIGSYGVQVAQCFPVACLRHCPRRVRACKRLDKLGERVGSALTQKTFDCTTCRCFAVALYTRVPQTEHDLN